MSAFTHQNRRTRQRNRASEKDKRTFRRKRKQLETPQYKTNKAASHTLESGFVDFILRTLTISMSYISPYLCLILGGIVCAVFSVARTCLQSASDKLPT